MLAHVSLVMALMVAVRAHVGGGERVIVLLVDGVRWDYISRDAELKGFPRMARDGVRAEYVEPIFPSNSYPNWYSIVTGLYAENHGFVQNYMYNKELDDIFTMAPSQNASHEHWWNQSEPVWVTAEREGKKVSMHWWDGCQVEIRGVKPTECHQYEHYWVWVGVREDTEEALGNILTWFESSDDHKLALVYYEGVDAVGHLRGPDSVDTKEEMRNIDAIIDRFLESLEERKMKEKVNLVVVSDHGMAVSERKATKIIQLEDYDGLIEDIELMLDRGSVTMILPVEGREEQLYQNINKANIKGVHVYRKEDIPERYHLKNNDLVLPILMVADEGVFIQKISNLEKMKPSYSQVFKGYHGYDPDTSSNMRTIFYAQGPSFKSGYESPPLKMVDHYNVFCRLLEIEPLPNNGSMARVEGFFKPLTPERASGSISVQGYSSQAYRFTQISTTTIFLAVLLSIAGLLYGA